MTQTAAATTAKTTLQKPPPQRAGRPPEGLTRLQEVLDRHGITQKWMEDMTGLYYHLINKYCRGKRRPKLKNMRTILGAVNGLLESRDEKAWVIEGGQTVYKTAYTIDDLFPEDEPGVRSSE